jgi:hypothetical protein
LRARHGFTKFAFTFNLYRYVGESTKARQALHQSMKQAKHMMSETSSLLDKRIVSKLLLTYFERDQSADVLELMVGLYMCVSNYKILPLLDVAWKQPNSDYETDV